ncbi:GNAT family N-acetyltransferase [Streptomyces sp. NPDC017979]|uniref:GNAT family N-acetyltransferase n=1 Tax=Streptomyces sp. NPDC017979 TaxID=3365024 RepID=UPI0037BCF80F
MTSTTNTSSGAARLRPATAQDVDFLAEMLLTAFNWDRPRFTRDELLGTPHIAHYVTDWGKPGDFGVVAEDESGNPVGAAWARTFPADDPGYGYVGPGVPELTLGVLPGHRGRGTGGALLDALVKAAIEQPVEGLSLSVEDGNAAVRLYMTRGFLAVGREGSSDTMLLDLPQATSGRPGA